MATRQGQWGMTADQRAEVERINAERRRQGQAAGYGLQQGDNGDLTAFNRRAAAAQGQSQMSLDQYAQSQSYVQSQQYGGGDFRVNPGMEEYNRRMGGGQTKPPQYGQAPQVPQYSPMTPNQQGYIASTRQYSPTYGGAGFDPNGKDWRNSGIRDSMIDYENMRLAQEQFNQNNYQYGKDFNEDQRRFNLQFDWQKQSDIYAQQLAGKQYELADWQAKTANEQFGRQLDFEQLRNEQQYGLQREGQTFNQGLQRDQFSEGKRQFDQQYGLQSQNQQFQQGMTTKQFGESQRQFNQRMALDTQQFAESQRQFNQQYGLQERQFGEGTRQFDVSQQNQMQMARENRQSQELQSRYAAFGRAQAPNARMMRSW